MKKILMIMTALFLFCGCAAKSAKTSATSVEQTKAEEKQNSSVSENTDQKQTEQVSKNKKQASNSPSEKESAKAEKEKGKSVSKTEKKSKSKKNIISSEKKVSSSPVISEDTSDSHIHDWVHHEATGHYETKTITDKAAWTETVIDQAAWDETPFLGVKCYGCGQIFPNSEACFNHECDHSVSPYEGDENVYGPTVHHPVVTHDVNHPAETHQENVWIQDSAAYDECSICGVKK